MFLNLLHAFFSSVFVRKGADGMPMKARVRVGANAPIPCLLQKKDEKAPLAGTVVPEVRIASLFARGPQIPRPVVLACYPAMQPSATLFELVM